MDATPPPAPPPPPPAAAPVATAPAGEDKTVAIIAYITLIGFIIAIIMHGNKKTQLGSYHLRQALGLLLTGFVVCFPLVIPLLNIAYLFLMPFIGLGMFVLVILGLISAVNGQMKPVPLVGPLYQKWFATAFT
ncbi:MAG TPA: hypothetical protein VHD32_05095 [Candidatus Didemnitutus sp.]|nr:hypothetical protein [Candidatus Didemnitutus sp.]